MKKEVKTLLLNYYGWLGIMRAKLPVDIDTIVINNISNDMKLIEKVLKEDE